MTPIEALEEAVKGELRGTKSKIDPPSKKTGTWWLDLERNGHPVTAQWSPKRPSTLGVSASVTGDGIGEGPEETFTDVKSAAARIVELLRGRSFTRPPAKAALYELRSLAGVTQVELADRLGIGQAAVSRFERRDDVTIQSLAKYVDALGATLEIAAVIKTGERVVVTGGFSKAKRRPAKTKRKRPRAARR